MNYTKAYIEYYPYVYNICKKILNEKATAEDAAQETLYKLMIKWDTITDYNNMYGWLQRTARNTCIDIIRKRNREWPCSEIFLPDTSSEDIGASLLQDAVTIVENFSPKFKEVFKLAFIEGYTNQEIAEQLGIPLSTVKTRIRTCLLKLRDELI